MLPPQSDTPAGPPSAHVADTPTILVADDSALNRRLLAAILARDACRVLEAADGEQALAMARAERPDLVLLDILMPGMDGYEVCAAAQADRRLAEMPIIVLSALSEPSDKVRALELGAVDYVTKPFDQAEVLARVRNQLRIQRLTASLRAANRELLGKQRLLDADLRAAADIQASLIPRKRPLLDGATLAWSFIPSSSVGGDLFNVQQLDERHVAIWVVDVSGHGVPAAMVTVSVCQSLSLHAGIVLDGGGRPRAPAEVLAWLDREYPIERFDKYFTMSYALLELDSGRLRYCNAAHPHPLLLRRDGTLELLRQGGTIVGLGGVLPFEEGEVQLEPGDRLFLYTDGVVEQRRQGGEQFGSERLVDLLLRAGSAGVEAPCRSLASALEAFAGGQGPDDDVTLVGLEYTGRPTGGARSGKSGETTRGAPDSRHVGWGS